MRCLGFRSHKIGDQSLRSFGKTDSISTRINRANQTLIIQKPKLHLLMLYQFPWLLVNLWQSPKVNEGKEDSAVSFFCHLLTKQRSSFGSGLTPGFINVSSLCPRKQKAGGLLTHAHLSKNRIILRYSESPSISPPADFRALTAMLTLHQAIDRILSKSLSVTSKKNHL